MSRNTVVWLREAIDELGEIWLAAADRNAVTEASEEIDRSLQDDAEKKGKPLSEGMVMFEVANFPADIAPFSDHPRNASALAANTLP